MRKFGLLSIVLTVFLALLTVLVACNGDTVSEHDHVWDGGTVTVEPTCHSEGLRTYACTVEGCTQTKTEPIGMTQHNWNDGEITEQSTCRTQGTKTYACQNEGCNATKTEKLQKSAHNWDEGVLTKVPDFYTPGSKKYTCLTEGCNETRTESVGAHADFAEQYYASYADANNWSYGYATDIDVASKTYTFTQITQLDDQSNAYKAEGVEISKGYVFSQNHAAVAYTFKEVIQKGIQTHVAISFVGEDSATCVKAYLFVTHTTGDPTMIELNQAGTKDWTYASEEPYDLTQGDTFAVVFSNEGEGKAGGKFTFTLTAPCNHVWGAGKVKDPATCEGEGSMLYTCLNCGATKEETIDPIGHNWDQGVVTKPATETEQGVRTYHCLNGCGQTKTEGIPMLVPSTFDGANLATDFASVLSGDNGAWQIGVVDFKSDAEFTFNPLTTKSKDAFTNGDPYMEIKGDWAAINGWAGIAYTFGADANVDLHFNFTANGGAVFAIRWAIKNADGTIISNDGNASWGGKTSGSDGTVTINQTIDFHVGDTIYILIHREDESTGDQCNYTYTLTKHSDGPVVPSTGTFAEFKKDFHDNAATNNWEYGSSKYAWNADQEIKIVNESSTESFTFTQGSYNAENQAWESGDASIKAGSVDIRNNATIVYHFGEDMAVDISLSFKGEEGKTVHSALRMVIVDNEGKGVKKLETFDVGSNTKNEWTATFENIEVKADYKIYIIFFVEGETNDSSIAEFDCKFAEAKTQGGDPVVPGTEFNGAVLADDFASTIEGNVTGWKFGKVEYKFDGIETFEFTEIAANADKTAYESGNNSLNGTGATIVDSMMGIAYTFGSDAKVDVNFVLTCDTTAKFSVRWAIKNSAGEIINGANGKANWGGDTGEAGSYTLDQTVDVHTGDTLYILINHENGGNQCSYTFSLTKNAGSEPVVPPTQEAYANFNDDFQATLDGEDNGWSIGNVEYKFGQTESFEFFKSDIKNGDSSGFSNVEDKSFFEIKGDWAAIGGWVGIAYTFKEAGDFHFNFEITGKGQATFSVRYAVKSESGEVKLGPEFAGNDAHVAKDADITVEEGDILYIIIHRESGDNDNQCDFSLELNKKA